MIEAERLYNKIIESTGLVPESNQNESNQVSPHVCHQKVWVFIIWEKS